MMKNILYLLSSLLLFLGVSSCRHCSSIGNITIPYYMNEYFSVYYPGSYFIFLNQDSTKRDSIYVTNYDTSAIVDSRVRCLRWSQSVFTINSQYLSSDKMVNVKISYPLGSSSPFCSFSGMSVSEDRVWNFYAKANTDTFYINRNPLTILNRIMFYKLWNNPQYTVVEVTPWYQNGQGTVYFAPQTGIVKYVTNDLKDSFTLVKFFTP